MRLALFSFFRFRLPLVRPTGVPGWGRRSCPRNHSGGRDRGGRTLLHLGLRGDDLHRGGSCALHVTHRALKLLLEALGAAPELTQSRAEALAKFGQFARSEHEQGDKQNHQDLTGSETWHP